METTNHPTPFSESNTLPKVVVVGGGFAGIEFVKNLDTRHYQVLIIDRHNYHTFQPLLYQVATAGLEPDSIAQPLRKIFAGKKNFFFRMATVQQVHLDKKTLDTDIGEIPFDILVFAVGTKTNYFGNDALRQGTFPLKQVPNALDLRSHILQSFEAALLEKDYEARKAYLHFIIVGGGPTGVELAGALAELRSHVLPQDYPELDFSQMQITLVEGMSKVLASMTPSSSERALKYLKGFGVRVMLNSLVQKLDGTAITLQDGSVFHSHNVIWSAGVTGNLVPGFPKEVITRANRLRVDGQNLVVGTVGVYALGDIAAMETEQNPQGHPQLAPVAIQQGVHLAKNLNRTAKGGVISPFSYFNKGSMATIGRNKAVVDLPNNWSFGGLTAWLAWMFIHLLYLVGFRNKIVVVLNWIYNYFTYDRGTRLIIRPFIRSKSQPSLQDSTVVATLHDVVAANP